MNLSQLCELKEGDKVVCKRLPAFTIGKAYTVTTTPVGRMIDDDNSVGQFLHAMEHFFEIAIDDAAK